MRRFFIGAFVGTAAVFAACRASDVAGTIAPQVTMRLAATSDAPGSGSLLRLELANAGPAEVGFNLCANGQLEQQVDGRWVAVGIGDRLCTTEMILLPPRVPREASYRLPPALTPGQYRLVAQFLPAFGGVREAVAAQVAFTIP